jgi:holo-[acyl-carrier protein] synthase
VEVVRTGLEAPGLVLSGGAAAMAAGHGVSRWHLSLSHTGEVAVALVVAEGEADRAARSAAPPAKP